MYFLSNPSYSSLLKKRRWRNKTRNNFVVPSASGSDVVDGDGSCGTIRIIDFYSRPASTTTLPLRWYFYLKKNITLFSIAIWFEWFELYMISRWACQYFVLNIFRRKFFFSPVIFQTTFFFCCYRLDYRVYTTTSWAIPSQVWRYLKEDEWRHDFFFFFC